MKSFKCLNKYYLKMGEYNNIKRDKLWKYIYSKKYKLWTWSLKDTWGIHSSWILFFCGDEGLECNFILIILMRDKYPLQKY